MKKQTTNAVAIFFAGFFAKDVIDDVFFLMIDKYPLDIFGFQITATAHKVMLGVSLILTSVLLYYGLRKNRGSHLNSENV